MVTVYNLLSYYIKTWLIDRLFQETSFCEEETKVSSVKTIIGLVRTGADRGVIETTHRELIDSICVIFTNSLIKSCPKFWFILILPTSTTSCLDSFQSWTKSTKYYQTYPACDSILLQNIISPYIMFVYPYIQLYIHIHDKNKYKYTKNNIERKMNILQHLTIS